MTRPMSLLARTLSIVLLLAIGTTSFAAAQWPHFRGPAGTGRSLQDLPPGDGPLSLEIAWKVPLGSGYSGISIAAGTLVTAFQEGDADYLVALDPDTGDEIWRYELSPAYIGIDGSHDGPISTPAIADGRVFMLARNGRLVAVELTSGKEIWSRDVVEELGSETPYYGFGSSPAVVGNIAILQIGGADGSVAGFDAKTGELRWRTVEDEIFSQSPIILDRGDSRQVLVLGSKRLVGLDPTDGTELWAHEHQGEEGAMGNGTSSPLPLGPDRIFLKYDDAASAVIELARIDGIQEVLTAQKTKGMTRSYSPPTVLGHHLYGFTARFLSAVDPASGDQLWRTRDVGDGFVISIADHLAVIEKTGSLHLGTATPEGWSKTASVLLFDDLAWTPPSYADGSLYVRSLGEIARVDLSRAGAQIAAAATLAPPAALAPLVATLKTSDDPTAEVDRFLADHSLPIIDGENVVFLWQGDNKDVAIAGDMIGMRREEPMHRLEGTDLWWWETRLDRRARISYLFYADYAPARDPGHDRFVQSTVLGPDMNWFRGVPVEMSWFAMPEWPGLSITRSETTTHGRLEEIALAIQPTAGEDEEAKPSFEVPARVWLPPRYDDSDVPYPVVYVQANAVEAGDWPATLDRVVGQSVEPLIVVFIDPPRRPDTRGALAAQIVPQIDERFRTRTDRASRAVVGMGWPGLGATLTAFFRSDLFGVLGVQSLFLVEGPPMEDLLGAIGENDASILPMRIYLEWGKWDLISPHEEMNQREFSRWAWDLLTEKGWAPIGGEVWDSTDFASWANRTDVLLEALFPLDGTATDLHLWQTGTR